MTTTAPATAVAAFLYRGTRFTYQPVVRDGWVESHPDEADPEEHAYRGDGTDPCRVVNCAGARCFHLTTETEGT